MSDELAVPDPDGAMEAYCARHRYPPGTELRVKPGDHVRFKLLDWRGTVVTYEPARALGQWDFATVEWTDGGEHFAGLPFTSRVWCGDLIKEQP